MKVVFLDIDGVLNYTKWYIDPKRTKVSGHEDDIDPECIKRVSRICDLADAKIVVSSDWRLDWEMTKRRLTNAGLDLSLILDKTPEFIWRTGDDYEYTRGDEINEWLRLNHVKGYAVLDDRTDFTKEQEHHLVHINPYVGLTDGDVKITVDILNKQ